MTSPFVVPFESDDLCPLIDTSRALVFLVGSTSGSVNKGRQEITSPSGCAKDNP